VKITDIGKISIREYISAHLSTATTVHLRH